jgi:hypothetical protein
MSFLPFFAEFSQFRYWRERLLTAGGSFESLSGAIFFARKFETPGSDKSASHQRSRRPSTGGLAFFKALVAQGQEGMMAPD